MKTLLTIFFLFPGSLSLFAQENDSNLLQSRSLYLPLEKIIYYKLGDRTIPLRLTQYGNSRELFCINLHSNEFTSVEAVKPVLEETGGTLLQIENNRQRVIVFRFRGMRYGFDPNRIYSREGIEQTLKDNGRFSREALEEVEKFARRVLDLLPDSAGCVVALHNNTEEAFSVRSYLPGSDKANDARAVYADSLQDVDDIILTTDSILYQRMAEAGYNSVWQDNVQAKKDGSLSIYFGERNRRYINIETQHGKRDQYREMFRRLCSILDAEKERKNTPTEGQTAPNLLINN